MSKELNDQLVKFETLVYSKKTNVAKVELVFMLLKIYKGDDFACSISDYPARAKLYSRLASAIICLMGDPNFNLGTKEWGVVAAYHAEMQTIFECSVFDTAEHLLPMLVKDLTDTRLDFKNTAAMGKYLLTFCMSGNHDLDFNDLLSTEAAALLPLWLGMLSDKVCLHPNAHIKREKLVDTGKYFEDFKLPPEYLGTLSEAYMYASYLTRPDKHKLKPVFSKLFRTCLTDKSWMPSTAVLAERRSVKKDKPKILFMLEQFTSGHAMYRCYAKSIMQLREHFHLVSFTRIDDGLDEKSSELFDEFIWTPKEEASLLFTCAQVREIAPDIIFYPSVGMDLRCTVLAQERFAPIQIMMLGHPASTFSPAMDYVIAEHGFIPNFNLFSEVVVEVPEGSIGMVPREDMVIPEPTAYVEGEPVKIAVAAMIAKISVPFLEMCRRIEEKAAPQKVEWHFFPHVLGMRWFQARRHLMRWFSHCVIHQGYKYPFYLEQVGKCDLFFSTFPFGGTNSVVDSLFCGLPVINLEGEEPHERFDSILVRRVGKGEWVAQNIEEYERIAVELIKNHAARESEKEYLRNYDLHPKFYGPAVGEQENAVLKAVQYVYDNHEKIQASKVRRVTWESMT